MSTQKIKTTEIPKESPKKSIQDTLAVSDMAPNAIASQWEGARTEILTSTQNALQSLASAVQLSLRGQPLPRNFRSTPPPMNVTPEAKPSGQMLA